MNPHMIEFMLKEKRQQMLEEAEHLRLLTQFKIRITREKRIKRAQLMLAISDLLLRTGYRIKKKYEQTLLTTESCKTVLR